MNDIVKVSDLFNFILYCDDTSLLTTCSVNTLTDDFQFFNSHLVKITNWLCNNKLSLNILKTKCMAFKGRRKFCLT